MALIADKLKKDIEKQLLNALNREFKDSQKADADSNKKLAAAISDIALVIVKALQTEAEVLPAIPTAGSPASQVTTAPGRIA
jgi:hypothetical protein